MIIFFEIMKFVFFVISVLLGLFFYRGELLFDADQYMLIQKLLMPGYMILCGMMVGYLIGSIWLSKNEMSKEKSTYIYTIALVFGLVLGIILAVINIYFVL